MTDQEVAGSILQILHERRHENGVHLTTAFDALGVPMNVLRYNLTRLRERNLIEWQDMEVRGLGRGRITDYGGEVVTAETRPPIPMVFHNININNSSGIIVGNNNTQTNVDIES